MVRRNKDKRYLFLGIAIAVILAVALIINSEKIQLGPPLDGELEGLFGNRIYTDLVAALANCEARATAEFIEVSTCEGLKGIDNNLRKNYRLMNDLTCNFEPIAFGAGDFKGIFDGQNHTVNYEYTSDSRGKVGLFSDVGNCGIIKNLHVDANVKGTSRVGAIAGYVYKGILKEVYATGNVEATAEAVGGLVGGLESGGIIDSYSEVSVQGTEKVGGLVGAMWKSLNEEQTPIVKNTYANGKVIAGGAQAGGLIGLCDYQPMSSYWNLDVYFGDNGCGVGKTDGEMKQQATFVGWNFAKTWRIDESADYPRLRWQEEESDCIEVWTAEDLDNVRNDLSACYKQMDDISLGRFDNWEPIGDHLVPFSGKYTGNYRVISGMDIEVTGTWGHDLYVGLFGHNSGVIEKVVIERADVSNERAKAPEQYFGILAGLNTGTIDDVRVRESKLADRGIFGTGAIAATNEGNINNAVVVDTIIKGSWSTGGIAGFNRGLIENSSVYSEFGEIISYGPATGGLVGSLEDGGIVRKSDSDIVVRGDSGAGGLVGDVETGFIEDSSSVGDVYSSDPGRGLGIGGLVGYADGLILSDSYATGNVYDGRNAIGGLVGYANGTIKNSYATGNVTGQFGVGGLVGISVHLIITNSSAYGIVRSLDTGNGQAGGLVGALSDGKILDSYATGNVYVMQVESNYSENFGGLVGYGRKVTIANSYATGDVYTNGSFYVKSVGGLVGGEQVEIKQSYASGNVYGSHSVGGLIGENSNGKIDDSYATGKTTGNYYQGSENVGGLAGRLLGGSVVNSYSAGEVINTTRISGDVNGFVGFCSDVLVESSYWDIDTSGRVGGECGEGKTTAEMKKQATFVGWDFSNIWNIIEDQTYPWLRGLEN
ncbi:hypothetical protein AUJ84_00160 [Candidatus Pacearchaeota archaeon CG1_02_32_132]|nr:MAG: hypothetical protein AUJ84_00160 [Candidatus Pacearchaeota archaeon CG1_02_32_132]